MGAAEKAERTIIQHVCLPKRVKFIPSERLCTHYLFHSGIWIPIYNAQGMSASLLRARRPFFLRNMATGIAVASFAVGVWAYSISAVKQDVFDDVDEQARALNASSSNPVPTSSETLSAIVTEDSTLHKNQNPTSPVLDKNISKPPKGLVFTALGNKYPWLFEPTHKTMVWGAPPVDHIGRIDDKIPVQWRK